jgi:hypothetical protein
MIAPLRLVPFALAVISLAYPPRAARAQSMEGVGFQYVLSMSYDGSAIVGLGPTTEWYPVYHWSKDGGLQQVLGGDLGDNDGAHVSGDGQTVVGDLYEPYPDGQAFSWRNGTQTLLPALHGAGVVSYDGSTIIGYLRNDEGNVDIVGLDGTNYGQGLARDIDSTGTVFVGYRVENEEARATIWPSGIDLGQGMATAVSPDGTVVVGHLLSGGSQTAFRWTQGTGIEMLGQGVAIDVTRDGSVVIGNSNASPGVWSEGTFTPIRDYLQDNGVDVGEWQILTVRLISQDGNVLSGIGLNPSGESEVWRAALIPCLVVTHDTDEADADAGDAVCDIDTVEEGDQCTLRAAIEESNALGGRQCVHFDVRDAQGQPLSGLPVIRPTSPLPTVTDSLTVDGTTQAFGFVEIDGSNAGTGSGFAVEADSFHVRGLLVNRFEEYGIRLSGGAGHVVQENRIGFDENGEELRLNGLGGILVEGGAMRVLVGSEEEGNDENSIGGGVVVQGEDTREVSVLRNVLEVKEEWLSDEVTGVPLDLDGDGPTCAAWMEQSTAAANNHMAAPRITRLEAGTIAGMTRPGSKVVAFRATKRGADRGRYFARRVEPVGFGEAGEDGRFTILADIAAGDTVAVTATDVDGNTSELSQLIRPVVFLPGIGGTWLEGSDGASLWLPGGISAVEVNDRLYRLRMDAQGNPVESVSTAGVIELGGVHVYGPILTAFEDAGYAGSPDNEGGPDLDLWRFPNDWRRSTHELADELREFVDRLTGGGDDVAFSCQVDLVAHSNGGLIGSAYLKRFEESENRVQRFLTIGTPYLGTPQAAAAHTVGYVFEVEKVLVFAADWGRMIAMTRNVAGALGLMPSAKYWEASSTEVSYLVDLFGVPLASDPSTRDFLERGKVNPDGIPDGLFRNAPLWSTQQTEVHDRIDDWRSWSRPPQVFRFAGDMEGSTAVGWYLGPGPEYLPLGSTVRSEVMDTDRHRAYRERLRPSLGIGDGTVSLVSATLGRDPRVGSTDFSGVDESPWIEDFEFFPCAHTGLVLESCTGTTGGAVDRALHAVRSAYSVPESGTGGKRGFVLEAGRDVVHVSSGAPVRVWVEAADGRVTGPGDADDGGVHHAVDEAGYWSGAFGAIVSVPAGGIYTVRATAPLGGVVHWVHTQAAGASSLTHRLFADTELGPSGGLRMSLGSTPDPGMSVDADGDGSFESEVEAATSVSGEVTAPPLPSAQPSLILATSDGASPMDADVRLAAGSTEPWQWTADTDAEWIEIGEPSGMTSHAGPATLALTLAADALSEGRHMGEVTLTYTIAGYETVQTLAVELLVGSAALAAPSGVLPEDGAADLADPVALEWTPVVGAERYEVQVSRDPAFHEIQLETGATATTLAVPGLDAAGSWHWRVRAVNGGLQSPYSAPRSFSMALFIGTEDGTLPTEYALDQNYPNPFNPTTEIVFALPEAAPVQLAVHDLLGRQVALLVDGTLPPGVHRLQFHADGLPSGMYFLRMLAGGEVRSRAITLVK